MPMTLAYWDIRGLAQPIRLLLEYTGEEYEDKYYVCGEAPNYDKTCWIDVKNKLGLDFPNLPYLLDGDRKITQSNAIMRYIARKHNMCGETEDEKIRVDVLENQAMDLRLAFIKLTYLNIDQKPEYLKNLQCTLKQFSDFLGGRKWFVGDKVCYSINKKGESSYEAALVFALYSVPTLGGRIVKENKRNFCVGCFFHSEVLIIVDASLNCQLFLWVRSQEGCLHYKNQTADSAISR
uniref:glutathione transferase n=1 Tax=Oreochromis niloticus TaxID=8128 RepID=A0A669D913_ORENI